LAGGPGALAWGGRPTATVAWCTSMSAMGGMAMPGGWTMSMTWMRMPGQTWPGAAAAFLGMWVLMMAAMMAPSLVGPLARCREAMAASGGRSPGGLTGLVAVAYLLTWSLAGLAAFAVGASVAALAMAVTALSAAVPAATAVVILTAGAVQCTGWKARRLARCRDAAWRAGTAPASARAAWRHGWRLGVDCLAACAPLTAILLALGVMDLAVMTLVAVAITLERLAPAGERAARAVGAVAIAAGTILLGRALGG
jgi:predicted metal-binding membrane protein